MSSHQNLQPAMMFEPPSEMHQNKENEHHFGAFVERGGAHPGHGEFSRDQREVRDNKRIFNQPLGGSRDRSSKRDYNANTHLGDRTNLVR